MDRIEQPTPNSVFAAGRPAIGNPIRQARNSGRRLNLTLEAKGVTTYEPKSILVFPGWKVGKTCPESDVLVTNETLLGDYLKALPTILEVRDVITLCEILDSAAIPENPENTSKIAPGLNRSFQSSARSASNSLRN